MGGNSHLGQQDVLPEVVLFGYVVRASSQSITHSGYLVDGKQECAARPIVIDSDSDSDSSGLNRTDCASGQRRRAVPYRAREACGYVTVLVCTYNCQRVYVPRAIGYATSRPSALLKKWIPRIVGGWKKCVYVQMVISGS